MAPVLGRRQPAARDSCSLARAQRSWRRLPRHRLAGTIDATTEVPAWSCSRRARSPAPAGSRSRARCSPPSHWCWSEERMHAAVAEPPVGGARGRGPLRGARAGRPAAAARTRIAPFGELEPRKLWILVLLFCGLSFAGYVGAARGGARARLRSRRPARRDRLLDRGDAQLRAREPQAGGGGHGARLRRPRRRGGAAGPGPGARRRDRDRRRP